MTTPTPYSLGFCFSSDEYGRRFVALIRKNKPEWQAGKLNGIGGKIEAWETAIEGMVREFREETGWYVYESEWRLFARYRVTGALLFCYVARIPFVDFQQIKTNTLEEVIRIPMDELHLWVQLNNLDWLIPMAQGFLRTGTLFNICE